MDRTLTDLVGSFHHAVGRTIDRGAHTDLGAMAVRIGGAAGLGTLGVVAAANGATAACVIAAVAGMAVAVDIPGRLGRRRPDRA